MYPASRIPLATIELAVCSTKVSLMFEANVFQVFQPIGGVMARPSNFLAKTGIERQRNRQRSFFMGLGKEEEMVGTADRVVKLDRVGCGPGGRAIGESERIALG